MNRVLYLSANAGMGGAEVVTLLLTSYHRRNRFEAELALFQDGPLAVAARERGVKVHILHAKPRLRDPRSCVKAAIEIAQLLKRESFSMIHSSLAYGHLLGGFAAAQAKIPSAWFQHGPTGTLDWPAARIPTGLLIANSRYTLEQEKKYRPHAKALRVLFPGIEDPLEKDPQALDPGAAQIRAGWGFAPEDLVLGLFGRMSPLKGHRLLLEAVEALHLPSRAQVRVLFAGSPFSLGDSEYERELRQVVQESGLARQVHFCGQISYPPFAALRACDIVVNASVEPEGFGLTLAEAMMVERAVIGPGMGGPAEIIESGASGLTFEMRNPKSLSHAIERLSNDASLRTRMGQEGRKEALTRFHVRTLVEHIESEYEALISS